MLKTNVDVVSEPDVLLHVFAGFNHIQQGRPGENNSPGEQDVRFLLPRQRLNPAYFFSCSPGTKYT